MTTTADITNRREFWSSRGVSLRAISALPRNPAAAEIRPAWNYRAENLSAEQARKIIAEARPAAHHGGFRGSEQLRRAASRRAWFSGSARERENNAWSGLSNPEYGRFVRAARERRHLRAQRAELAAKAERPSDWLTARLSWENSRLVLGLPDGKLLVTTRRENAEWEDGKKYPVHTEVSYRSELLPPAGQAVTNMCQLAAPLASVTHDARGDWRRRVLTELGLISGDNRADMHLRLHAACTAHPRHTLHDGSRVGERRLLGLHVDYYCQRDGIAYHAPTVSEAVRGLSRKLRRAEAAARGELITAAIAHDRWGFCRPGLSEFAEAAGLDVDGEYCVEEIAEAITPEIREIFSADLKLAGI